MFQEHQLNSRIFPEAISNSRRFTVFPGVAEHAVSTALQLHAVVFQPFPTEISLAYKYTVRGLNLAHSFKNLFQKRYCNTTVCV